jgi:catechol 2,3-dioxygenase
LNELRAAKRELEQAGLSIDAARDHTASQSLYLRDLDCKALELYVAADEAMWKNDPTAVLLQIKPGL